jgi:hypothetical protein
MKRLSKLLALTALVSVALTLAVMSGGAQAAPGSHTQKEVNESIEKGVAYIDTQQNLNGSYGTTAPFAETGMSLVAYSVLANGNFESLKTTYQEHVKKAIEYLLKEQGAEGFWADSGFYETYSTSIAIAGLEPFKGVNAGIPAAIKKGREFLEGEFQGTAFTGCSSEEGSLTASFCGGWNYDKAPGRSDESNTGFAMFGLHQTGGLPAAIASQDIGWQHHIQEISTNSFATRNDGGGSYEPGINSGSFSSNANDTGSMVFGFGYDGVAATNEGVKAGITLGEDVLNEYELEKEVSRTMVFHTGAKEDGTCKIGSLGCDWEFGSGEGGYHYSLFSLTKGLGNYIEAKLKEATNWYAKVVDLLLTQQELSGSWPADFRDDGSVLFATGLAVSSLGLVGVTKEEENKFGGNFVIGDKNAATGTKVTFWGAKWRKLNSLSGGSAPSAFKGFEDTPATAACGQSWTTDPGNSTPPPAGPLPEEMKVIVSSKISKSGSAISGDTVHVVVVKTNPGYAPNPGHAGTGTVVRQVC